MTDSIVITGMGITSPIGCSETTFWDALCRGKSGAAPIDVLDTTDLSRKIACQVREPIDVGRPMGRAAQLAVTASREALATAQLTPADLEEARVNVIVGTTMGETEFIEQRLTAEDSQWLSADHMRRIAAGRPGSIAQNVLEDLRSETASTPVHPQGSAVDLYGACAAGNMAFASAKQQLLNNECDIAIVGGADGFSRLAFIGFMRLRVMAAEVCRPFDQQRDGLFVGEGAVIFVLERETSARVRGATVRARLSGAAITCENYHPTRPHPDGDGLSRATREAILDAGLEPTDIDYVCAHGTGTPQNDAIEVKVMESCFPSGICFSSIKALTGHMMGAAAAVEAACCILSLEHQTLIPTWTLENVLEPCNLDAIQGAIRETPVHHVVNNSAGFGGYNASVVISSA